MSGFRWKEREIAVRSAAREIDRYEEEWDPDHVWIWYWQRCRIPPENPFCENAEDIPDDEYFRFVDDVERCYLEMVNKRWEVKIHYGSQEGVYSGE